jgi:glucose uptake protein GlcU
MPDHLATMKKSARKRMVFILTIIVSLFWGFGNATNVYHFRLVGAIFEILWLPMLCMLFALPVVSFIYLLKERFTMRSLDFYSLLLGTGILVFLIFSR